MGYVVAGAVETAAEVVEIAAEANQTVSGGSKGAVKLKAPTEDLKTVGADIMATVETGPDLPFRLRRHSLIQ